MREITDAELDQVCGGAGTGIGTADIVQGGPVEDTPVENARPAIGRATSNSGIFPVGHGTITAAATRV